MRKTPLVLLLPLALASAGCSCGSPNNTVQVQEQGTVVQGNPAVESALPKVEAELDGGVLDFGLNVPRQCDFFQQNAVRKVDILWVVDNSGSMKNSQAKLTQEFPVFIDSLLSLQPPVDFHIGVTSIDTDNDQLTFTSDEAGSCTGDCHPVGSQVEDDRCCGTKGQLHPFDLTAAGGGKDRYIACDSTGVCNVPKSNAGSQCTGASQCDSTNCQPDGTCASTGTDATAAFAQMASVGTGGSPVERGLYATYLALNRDDNLHAQNAASSDPSQKYAFIRPDAALFVIVVSDEDDSSCSPFVALQSDGKHPVDTTILCTTDPGCRCDASQLTWGSPDYFERFLESYKGFGHGDLVALGAVVCTDQQVVTGQFGDNTNPYHLGCPDQGSGSAYYGDRYIQVAQATGGTAISIRGSFANALQSLGFAVSGLRKDFRLSRGPFTDTLDVYVTDVGAKVCALDSDCATGQTCRGSACAIPFAVGGRSLGDCANPDQNLEYCKCDAGSFRNIMRFNESGQPPAQSTIEVCYDVNSNFNQVCQ